MIIAFVVHQALQDELASHRLHPAPVLYILHTCATQAQDEGDKPWPGVTVVTCSSLPTSGTADLGRLACLSIRGSQHAVEQTMPPPDDTSSYSIGLVQASGDHRPHCGPRLAG